MVSGGVIRARLAAGALLALGLAHTPAWLAETDAPGRSARVAAYQKERDGNDPPYVAFLQRVREATEPGTTIALVVPSKPARTRQWYVHRAEWELAGRVVTPVIDPRDGTPLEAAGEADLLLAWREDPGLTRPPEILLENRAGILARR